MVVTYNMTIQAVFFDLGGVILMEAARDFGIDARFSLMPGTVTRCLDVNSRWKEARVGLCSYEEWVDSVREASILCGKRSLRKPEARRMRCCRRHLRRKHQSMRLSCVWYLRCRCGTGSGP